MHAFIPATVFSSLGICLGQLGRCNFGTKKSRGSIWNSRSPSMLPGTSFAMGPAELSNYPKLPPSRPCFWELPTGGPLLASSGDIRTHASSKPPRAFLRPRVRTASWNPEPLRNPRETLTKPSQNRPAHPQPSRRRNGTLSGLSPHDGAPFLFSSKWYQSENSFP